MASVATIATVAVVVAAAAASAYAAYSASEAQAEAADFQKKAARNQAQAARDAAAVTRENRQEELRRVMGAQRARLGASGITPDYGSPLLVMMASAEQAQLDLERITYGGETRATAFRSEEILQGFYARSARRAGQIGAGTALLGGAASAYGAYSGGSTTTTSTNYGSGYQQYRAGERQSYG